MRDDTYCDNSAVSKASDASFADVCAFPILVQADEVRGLQRLYALQSRKCTGAAQTRTKVIIDKNKLLDSVGPGFGALVVA